MPGATGTIEAGERMKIGELDVRPLHTPGHTAGMLSFLVEHDGTQGVFTGDTLFRNSVGGVRAPGHTTYQDLKDSIMGTLMELDRRTVIHPGHTDPTTVGQEWETQRVHQGLAGTRSGGLEPVHGARRAGDADPAWGRLRRRPQGVGPVAGRTGRDRPGIAGQDPLSGPATGRGRLDRGRGRPTA